MQRMSADTANFLCHNRVDYESACKLTVPYEISSNKIVKDFQNYLLYASMAANYKKKVELVVTAAHNSIVLTP